MSAIIKVENVSKRFVLNHEGQERYTALRDVLTRKAASLLKGRTGNQLSKEEFWALKDVSFEIERGDRVGIIGRNGAGKSTLLKILSRITEPSSGRITIAGRVASLLEVGTGFHPELTGRENIFLNGAILGMSRAEIKRKFDEIVDFAEVEKFLDTPVKRYSSGMYVRLAFAVAAHLEPEILIVDEVLAVGDTQFQNKCIGKMQDVSTNEGRTVLFVSHNMSTLKSICSKFIYMRNGELVNIGASTSIIQEYLNHGVVDEDSETLPREHKRKYNTGTVFFSGVRVLNSEGIPKKEFGFGEQISIQLSFEVDSPVTNAVINLVVMNQFFDPVVLVAESNEGRYVPRDFSAGKHTIEIVITQKLLPQNYNLSVFMADYNNGTPLDWVENVKSFTVSGVSQSIGSDYPWGVVHGFSEATSVWRF